MGLSNWFGWSISENKEELPDIFPIGMKESEFVKTDVVNIYSKILTDVVERVQGLKEDQSNLLWDNCLKSEASDGLISLLSKAMADKKELFLVYDKALPLLRIADSVETQKIKDDYAKSGKSSVGVFISFKNYTRSDMVKLYSALEYCTVSALNKTMNLSKAIQIKMSDMRASTALTDSAEVKSQAIDIARNLSRGKDILVDAKDIIETSKPDLTAVKESIIFLNQKRAFYLGMPSSYITGEMKSSGLSDTGEADEKSVERGLKAYYFSIMKPVLEVLLEAKITYKSKDFRQIKNALEALKTFTLTDEEFLAAENKLLIMNNLLDFPEDTKGGPKPKPEPEAKTLPGKPLPGNA